jgi:integrase
MPDGESVLDYRDRAILKLYLYSGIRLSTGCRLKVSDFHQDGDEATIKLHEKGDKHRIIGIHFHAAQAIQEYIEKALLTSGSLVPPRLNPRSQKTRRPSHGRVHNVPAHPGLPRGSARGHEGNQAAGQQHDRALRFIRPTAPGHDRYPAARRRRRYQESSGPVRASPHHNHPTSRSAAAGWRLHEKGGKVTELPCHHNLEQFLAEWLNASGLVGEPSAPLLPTLRHGKLTGRTPLPQAHVHMMIQRRARGAGIRTKVSAHSFRATGITTYLQNGGKLDCSHPAGLVG